MDGRKRRGGSRGNRTGAWSEYKNKYYLYSIYSTRYCATLSIALSDARPVRSSIHPFSLGKLDGWTPFQPSGSVHPSKTPRWFGWMDGTGPSLPAAPRGRGASGAQNGPRRRFLIHAIRASTRASLIGSKKAMRSAPRIATPDDLCGPEAPRPQSLSCLASSSDRPAG